MRPLALVLLLLPVLALQAAPFPPPLTPERPLSDLVLYIAAGAQGSPVVASNGGISLAAWADSRSGRSRIYATRINAAGQVLDRGIVLSADPFARVKAVVWNGTHFAAVIEQNQQWSLVFVTPDGVVAGTRFLDLSTRYRWADSSEGGAGVRLLFLAPDPHAAVVDGDGDVLAQDVALAEEGTTIVGGSRGSEFLVLLRTATTPRRTVSVRLDGEGRVLSSNDTQLVLEIDELAALEGGPGGWVLVEQHWAAPRVMLQRFDELGVAAGPPVVLQGLHPEDQQVHYQPRIVRVNGGYTVVWHSTRTSGRSFTFAAFVPDQGAPGLPRLLHEWIGVTGSVAVTGAGGPLLLLTAVNRTEAISLDVFAQIVSESGVSSPASLAFSPTEQWRVAAAAGQNGYVTAWVERGPDAFERVMVRRVLPDGMPLGPELEAHRVPLGANVKDTAIASTGTHYLVTWRAGSTAYGRRMAAESGAWLDDAPFTIATVIGLAVASNGTDSVAVWSSDTGLQSRRILMTGDPLAEPVVTLADPSEATDVGIASNGSDYLVAWKDGYTDCIVTCVSPIAAQVLALRLRADGTKIDAAPLVLLAFDDEVEPGQPAVAWNAGRYLVAWTVRAANVDVEGALVTAEGAVLERRVPLADVAWGRVESLRVLAHRDQFVLVARELRELPPALAVYLSWTAKSFDAAGSLEGVFALPRTILADEEAGVETLSVASSGSAMLVVYDRISPPEDGNVFRVYGRLFGSYGGRRRAIR